MGHDEMMALLPAPGPFFWGPNPDEDEELLRAQREKGSPWQPVSLSGIILFKVTSEHQGYAHRPCEAPLGQDQRLDWPTGCWTAPPCNTSVFFLLGRANTPPISCQDVTLPAPSNSIPCQTE